MMSAELRCPSDLRDHIQLMSVLGRWRSLGSKVRRSLVHDRQDKEPAALMLTSRSREIERHDVQFEETAD